MGLCYSKILQQIPKYEAQASHKVKASQSRSYTSIEDRIENSVIRKYFSKEKQSYEQAAY